MTTAIIHRFEIFRTAAIRLSSSARPTFCRIMTLGLLGCIASGCGDRNEPARPAIPNAVAPVAPPPPPSAAFREDPGQTESAVPAAPGADDAPYVLATIRVPTEARDLFPTAGYVGHTDQGKRQWNSAGKSFSAGQLTGWAAGRSFKPRVSVIEGTKEHGLRAWHSKLEPGSYLFYVKLKEPPYTDWKWIEIKPDSRITIELSLDGALSGTLEILAPEAPDGSKVYWLPLDEEGQAPLPAGTSRRLFMFNSHALTLQPTISGGKLRIEHMRSGDYYIGVEEPDAPGKSLFDLAWYEGQVTVQPGKDAQVTLTKASR